MHRNSDFFEERAQIRPIHGESFEEHAALGVEQNMIGLRGQKIMRLRVKITECDHGFASFFELRDRVTNLDGLAGGWSSKVLEIQHK